MDPYNRYNSYSGSYYSSPSHHSHSCISPAGSFHHETPAPPNSVYPPPGYGTVLSLPQQPSYAHYPHPQAQVSNPYPATPPSYYPPPPYAYPPDRHPYPGKVSFSHYGSFHYQQTSFSNSHIESPAAPATFPSYPDHAYPLSMPPPTDTHYPNSAPTAPPADIDYPNSSGTVPSGSDSPPAKPYYPAVNDVLSIADMQISDKPRPPSYPVPPEITVHHSPYALPSQYSQNSFSYPSSPAGSLSSDASFPYSSSSLNSVQGQSLAIGPSQNTPNSTQMVPYQASKDVLLHGILDICIYEAKNLPNMDLFSENLRKLFGRTASGKLSNKLENASQHVITSDPYVTVSLSDAVVARTRVISNDINPVWNQHFSVPVAHNVEQVVFVVKDSDIVGAQLIGKVTILAENIRSCQRIEDTYPIVGSACKKAATLKISIQFFPVANQLLSRFGFGLGPDYIGVANTYFRLRTAGRVTLYQDAHVPDHVLPPITLDNQFVFTQGKCWHDICQAIMQARHLIYIIGWSVFHKVRLVRDTNIPTPVRLDTLGDLLKYKSQEGLRVLVLVWDDPTSRDILGFRKEGIMATHDEETRRFFKHSSVQVILCPRFAGKKRSWLKQQEVNIIFTHHQKTVILDSEASAKQRQIIAFLGGLDLCDGRYDTPQHNLFRTLGTVHKDDYHNPNLQGDIQCGGPREPWHDLHCKIEGPAAYDVLKNFEQRWIKAAKRHGLKKLSQKSNEDSLIALERLPHIMNQSDVACCYENDNEKWHVQIFRSIDSGSVKGFPKDINEVEEKNLVYIKNLVVDSSIHTAYVEAIRTAANFIYIENQYFLGSSYNWSQHREIGANNMIPMELALKVAEKIRANERFAVYIVIPMWPEGAPTSMSVQRILYWQGQTIQMMYETIYKALEETGLNRTYHPQDYLNFFCLGNREVKDPNEMQSPIEPTENSHAQAKKARRFMIYVHSKGMIVDDEYVIIGSANINQRSMDGSRDTEIAMGAYQPQYTRANKKHPHGQVYGYRMSLWAEHLGRLEQCFGHPESLECVRSVRMHSEHNWKQYVDNEITEMKGHLMQYPILVEANGKVKPLPGHKTFPDMGGNILGSLGTVPSYVKENLTI